MAPARWRTNKSIFWSLLFGFFIRKSNRNRELKNVYTDFLKYKSGNLLLSANDLMPHPFPL